MSRAEHSAYGSDLNCVISTWQGAGLHSDCSHIPHKFFKQIKSYAGRGGDPNLPCSPSLVWRAGFFPHNVVASLSETLLTCAAHISGRFWQCTSSSRTLLWTQQHNVMHFFIDAVTCNILTLCAYEFFTETGTAVSRAPGRGWKHRHQVRLENTFPFSKI